MKSTFMVNKNLDSMSIYLKGLVYSLLMVVLIGLAISALLWLFAGGLNYKHIPIIAIAIAILSPRFEVVTYQSGKSLQMKGFSVLIYNSYVNWRKRRKSKQD